MEHPCALLRLLVVGPVAAPPMRDRGCVIEPIRPAAAIFGSVYSCLRAFRRLGMILSLPCRIARPTKSSVAKFIGSWRYQCRMCPMGSAGLRWKSSIESCLLDTSSSREFT